MGEGSLAMGMEFRHWSIDPKKVDYQNDRFHTVSLYLQGGEKSYRFDQKSKQGGPGKFCIMPQGALFQWEIASPVDFAHLYFKDTDLKHFAAKHYDKDARMIELRDLVYQEHQVLASLIKHYISEYAQADILFLEQVSCQLYHVLIKNFNAFSIGNKTITGGLSASHRVAIKKYIEEGLAQKLTLDSLAEQVNLSPYHFARRFKQSFGLPPAQYISLLRVDKVKELLKTKHSLSQISELTGYSQQSHMTQCFKYVTRITPAAYQRLLSK